SICVVLIVRAGLIEVDPSLAAVAGALGIATIAILLAMGALIIIWREGIEGVGRSLLAIVIGVGLLAYPAYLGTKFIGTPAIADVTTDMRDPPRFDRAAPFRPRSAIEYPGMAAAELQRAAYPDIEPLQVLAPVQIAYEAARSVVSKRKW